MSHLLSQHDYPLVVQVFLGMRRLVAEIFPHKQGGVLFFDAFWPGASFNPFHHIPGEITGSGPWKVGETPFFEIDEEDPQYNELWAEYFLWCEAQKKDSSIKSTVNDREFVLELARRKGADV